jgi:hypothetical protein
MNKMRCNKKLFLAIGILFAVAVMFTVSPVSAAVSYPPAQSIQAMGVPAPTTGAPGLILDNFEYWDSPQDHGWTLQHPGMPNGYPVWGIGLGVGTIQNVVDFQQGSRVLEAYMPATVMVPNIQRFTISFSSPYTSIYTLDQLSVFSVKMRSPVAVETFDTYEIVIFATDGAVAPATPANIEFHLTPRANTDGALVPVIDPESGATLVSSAGGTEVINVNVGREVADGSWHQINVDLAKAYEAATGSTLDAAQRMIGLSVIGNQYRMDDVMLVSCALNSRIGIAPYLFHINNMYQMLYDPAGTSRLVFACDPVAGSIYPRMCDNDNPLLAQCTCPEGVSPGTTDVLAALTGMDLEDVAAAAWVSNKIPDNELNAAAWSAYAANSDLSDLNLGLTADEYRNAVEDYENNVAGRTIGDMKLGVNGGTILSPATPITLAIGMTGDVTIPLADVYALDIPQLINPEMAAGPNTFDNGINRIAFTGNIGGAHELGTCTDLITNLPITTIPPYVPLYGSTSLTPCCGNNAPGYLKANELGSTQAALMAAGYSVWPAIAVLNVPAGQNQIAENLVITVVASNGLAEDVEALTLITTNYPVTNYPPVIEDVDDQIFYVGQGPQSYQLNATDADSFTFSSAVQFANDIENITWNAVLNGLPTYAYGPWTDSLIDQKTGLVEFTPEFEGAYEMVVEVTDQDGAVAGAGFVIYCVEQGTWLNHPPVMLGDWDHPMIGTAGETLTLVFDGIVDPDGEDFYFSCNIGSIGVRDGNPVWEFQTSYPGNYLVEIVAYDTRGGYLVIPQEVIISPWWSN